MRGKFPGPEYLGVFVENHDNPRFLNRCNNKGKFTNAVVFSLLWEGIPVFYYGGEQYFNGENDPYNRETLWDSNYSSTELYRIIGKVNALRKQVSIWNSPVVQRNVNDNFYAFTRGKVLACFSNIAYSKRTITNHGFKEGDKLCNILYDNDCVTVSGGNLNIEIGYYPKVYVKQ